MEKTNKTTIRDFIEYKLNPTLFDRLPEVFPSMEFVKRRGNWYSIYHIDGSPSSSGDKYKSVVSKKYPNRITNTDGDYFNGKKSIDLIELYQYKNNGLNFLDSLRQMSDKLGLEFPELPPDEEARYQKRRQEQDQLSAIAERMREALFTHEGKETLAYLTRAKEDGGRGYDSELIKAMGLGCITPEIDRDLREIVKDKDFTSYPSGLGTLFTLAIVREERGRIVGFNFRRTDGAKDKYRNLYKNGVKSLNALPLLRLTGDYEKDYDLTIVEGELDALHAQAVGLENICASGREIEGARKTLINLRRFDGLRRVTILFDRGEDKTEEKIRTAINVIKESGLRAYVSKLPTSQDESGEDIKTDLDEYLLTHSADETIYTIKHNSLTATSYLLERLISDYEKRFQEDGRFDRERFIDEVHTLFHTADSVLEKDEIVKTIAYSIYNNGLQAWTEESLRKDLENYSRRQDERELSNEAKEKLSSFKELLEKGKLDEYAQAIEDESLRIKSGRVKADIEDILRDMSEEEVLSLLSEVPQEIPTKYEFRSENGSVIERLGLPQGAITIIGAPTSHGKSTLLRNLALDMAEKLKDGEAVLYFTFEEAKSAVLTQFLNSFANVEVHEPSKRYPQLKAIRAYLASGRKVAQYFREGKEEEFSAKVDEYFRRDYLKKIKIIDKDFDANSLISTLREAVRVANIKAVFIDYIQLMRKTGYKANRAEELKDICISLNTFAKDSKLPVVLASQLTRSITSPLGLVNSSLSESSDIEKSANTIICVWNGIEKPDYTLSDKDKKAIEELEARGKKELGFCKFGEGGFIYAKLTKNRGGVKNLEAFLKFNGNSGRILSEDEAIDEQLQYEAF